MEKKNEKIWVVEGRVLLLPMVMGDEGVAFGAIVFVCAFVLRGSTKPLIYERREKMAVRVL